MSARETPARIVSGRAYTTPTRVLAMVPIRTTVSSDACGSIMKILAARLSEAISGYMKARTSSWIRGVLSEISVTLGLKE